MFFKLGRAVENVAQKCSGAVASQNFKTGCLATTRDVMKFVIEDFSFEQFEKIY